MPKISSNLKIFRRSAKWNTFAHSHTQIQQTWFIRFRVFRFTHIQMILILWLHRTLANQFCRWFYSYPFGRCHCHWAHQIRLVNPCADAENIDIYQMRSSYRLGHRNRHTKTHKIYETILINFMTIDGFRAIKMSDFILNEKKATLTVPHCCWCSTSGCHPLRWPYGCCHSHPTVLMDLHLRPPCLRSHFQHSYNALNNCRRNCTPPSVH